MTHDRRRVRFEYPGELLRDQRPTEIVPLPFATVLGLEERELVTCFHAFCNHTMLEALAHADHGADDGSRI